MSGCGVTEIPSIMSHEFHPQGVGDRAPSARACCKSRQTKRHGFWVPGRNLLDVARCACHNLCDIRDAPSSKATAGRQDAGPARGRGLASAPRRRPRRRLSEPSVLRPRDRVQVKYEMLRRHRVDGRPVTEVAARFGVSRQTFYQTAAAFEAHGIPGLVPKRPGPKGAHKCTDAVVDYVERWRAGEDVQPDEPLTAAVARRFGISVHARSLDRAVARRKKNRARRRPHESVGPRYRSGVPPVRGRAA